MLSSVISRRFAKNSIYHFTAQVGSKGLFFLTTVYLARRLGATDYGKFAFAYGLVTLLSVVTKFGLDLLTSSEVGKNPDRASEYFTSSLLLRASLSLIFLLLLSVVVPWLKKPPEVNMLIFLLAATIIFQTLAGASTSLFEAFQFFGYRSVLNLCMFGFILAAVMLANHHNPGLIKSGYAFLIGAATYGLLAIVLGRVKISGFSWPPSFPFLRRLFQMALPLGLSEIFIGIYYRADTVLLSFFESDATVGWYDAAYTFVYGLRLLPVSVAMVLLPGLSKLFEDSPQQAIRSYRLAVRYSATVGFFLTFLVATCSRFLVHVVFGDQYKPSADVLPVLIWTCAIMFVNAFQGIFLVIADQRNAFFRATATGAISNILLNLLLIPKYGMFGAAYATVLSEFLVFLVSAVSLSKFLSWRDLLSLIGLPAVMIALLLSIWVLLHLSSAPWMLLVALIAYAVPGLISGSLRRER